MILFKNLPIFEFYSNKLISSKIKTNFLPFEADKNLFLDELTIILAFFLIILQKRLILICLLTLISTKECFYYPNISFKYDRKDDLPQTP